MSVVTAEPRLQAPPHVGGLDASLFKLLIVGLAVSFSITFRPVFLSTSSKHASLLYPDLPLGAAFAFLAFLAWVMDPVKVKTPGIRMFIPLFLLLGWWGISGLLHAQQMEFFVVSWLQYANGALMVAAAPWVLTRYRLTAYAMEAIMACSVGVSLVALVECIIQPHEIFENITSVTGPNHCHLGLYMLVALAIALHRSHAYPSRQWWPAGVAFLAFVSIMLSGSRSALAGSFILLAAYFFRRLSFANFFKLIVVAVMVGSVFTYIVKQRKHESTAGAQFQVAKGVHIDKSAGRRFLMWIVSWQVINSSPERFVQGIGFTNYRWEYGKLIKLPFYTNAAHNAFIHIWTETGLIGLLLYLSVYIVLFLQAWGRRKRDPPAMIMAALIAAMLVTCMTQETLYPNEAMCNFNVMFFFACLLMVMPADRIPSRNPG